MIIALLYDLNIFKGVKKIKYKYHNWFIEAYTQIMQTNECNVVIKRSFPSILELEICFFAQKSL